MVAALGYQHTILEDLADQSVLIGDPPRPEAAEVVLERFGLADAFIAVALDVLEKPVDALEDLPMASRRRRALAGERMRDAVSRKDS